MHKTRLRQQDGFVLYFYFLGVAALFFSERKSKLPLGGRGESPSEGEGGTEKEELFMAR